MSQQPPFFHEATGAVRFWVMVDETLVGASISREVLHHRYRPEARGEDPLETYKSHAGDLEAVVRRRVAQGSIEPVMLREFDLRVVPPAKA
jgi:hypothetical protein